MTTMAGPVKWLTAVALVGCSGTDVEVHVEWNDWNGQVTRLTVDGEDLPPLVDHVIEQSFADYNDAIAHFVPPVARVTINGIESETLLELPPCDSLTRHATTYYDVHHPYVGPDEGLDLMSSESWCDDQIRVVRQ